MTPGGLLLLAQALAAASSPPAPSPATPPDIELSAKVEAREIEIAQEGPLVIRLRAEPGVTDSRTVRSQPAGARSYRNLTIDARLAAWLTGDTPAPQGDAPAIQTGEPQ